MYLYVYELKLTNAVMSDHPSTQALLMGVALITKFDCVILFNYTLRFIFYTMFLLLCKK